MIGIIKINKSIKNVISKLITGNLKLKLNFFLSFLTLIFLSFLFFTLTSFCLTIFSFFIFLVLFFFLNNPFHFLYLKKSLIPLYIKTNGKLIKCHILLNNYKNLSFLLSSSISLSTILEVFLSSFTFLEQIPFI